MNKANNRNIYKLKKDVIIMKRGKRMEKKKLLMSLFFGIFFVLLISGIVYTFSIKDFFDSFNKGITGNVVLTVTSCSMPNITISIDQTKHIPVTCKSATNVIVNCPSISNFQIGESNDGHSSRYITENETSVTVKGVAVGKDWVKVTFVNHNFQCLSWINVTSAQQTPPITPTSAGPGCNYSQLPIGFTPEVGYYHALDNGRINLWDASGSLYVCNGSKWFDRTGSQTALGLPAEFIPKVGYFPKFIRGRIDLWDASGSPYQYSSFKVHWYDRTEREISSGLPSTFKPVVGYYHPFSGGRINLWDASGSLYIYGSGNGWIDRTGTQTALGLPATFKPVVGYYHPFSGGRLNLFDASGKVYVFNGTKWFDRTTALASMHLPTGKAPITGYFDEFKQEIILWYSGSEAYSSDDGTNFEMIALSSIENPLTERSPWCTDSDLSEGGIRFYTIGNVNYSADGINEIIKTDRCTARTVIEFYCSDEDLVANETHICPNSCLNGACVSPMREKCYDSDDGEDYETSGYVNYTLDTISTIFEDECDDYDTLKEFYCENNISKIKYHACENGMSCSNGRCIQGSPDECTTNAQCDTGEVCNSNNVCVPSGGDGGCTLDRQCGTGKRCVNHACVTVTEECSDDSDCSSGEICDSEGFCINDVECFDDSECEDDEKCSDAGKCKVIQPSSGWILWVIIIIFILLILGVIGYLIYYLIKKDKDKNKSGASKSNINTKPSSPGPSTSNTPIIPRTPNIPGSNIFNR